MSIHRFDLDSQGLARVLGELEARILETVWDLGQASVKDVTARLGSDTHVKTVMTVMNRMVEKGLLTRSPQGRHFVYQATTDRESFLQHVAAQVLSGLLSDFARPTMAHFVDGATPEQLAELERLIAQRRAQRRES
jgi:predicted transcriptional regulator